MELFKSLDSIEEFNIEYQETTHCNSCKYSPTKISKEFSTLVSCGRKKETYLHQNYLKVFEDKLFHCPKYKNKTLIISKMNVLEPKFLSLLDDGLNPFIKPLNIAAEFNSNTEKKYLLLGSINIRGTGHDNTTLINPFFEKGIQITGVLKHDGLGRGEITKSTWNEVYSVNKPYITLYKRVD